MSEDNAPEITPEPTNPPPSPEVTVDAAAEVVETAKAEVVAAAETVTAKVTEVATAATETVTSAAAEVVNEVKAAVPPPPAAASPAAPPSPPAPAGPSTLDTVLAILNKAWKFSLPWLLLGSISLLRLLVSALTKGLTSLETSAPKAAAKAPAADAVWQKAEPWWQKFWPLWQKLLGFLRGIAPANWRATLGELSDKALSWIIIGFLLLFLWFWSIITPDAKPAPKVTTRPPAPTRTISQAPSPKPSPVKATPTPPAVAVAPKPVPKPSPVAPAPAPIVAKAPEKPVPSPKPQLSKEQTLIADLRTQFKKSDPEGLIQDLKLNLPDSRLQVQLQSDWYKLSAPEQDKLAQILWQGSNRFDLAKLELLDPQNRLIARSPLVGNEMIVLRRSLG